MESEHRQDLDGSNEQQRGIQNVENRLSALERDINEQKQQIDVLLSEKRQLDHEMESQIKIKAQIELRIKDHEDNAEQSAESTRKNQEDLKNIEEEIRDKEQDLSKIVPEFQRLEGMERKMREEYVLPAKTCQGSPLRCCDLCC